MKKILTTLLHAHLTIKHLGISLDLSWLIILPLVLWAIATQYVPLLGANLNLAEMWVVAVLTTILVALSILCHAWIHRFIAYLYLSSTPETIPCHLFGDAAQGWPPLASFPAELFAALAGPVINLLIAGAAYLIYNAQLNAYLNLSMLFASLFNVWLAIVNLIPAFPLDGGRITRKLAWQWLRHTRTTAHLVESLGMISIVLQIGWGLYLIASPYQFSLQNGIITVVFALLFLTGLALHPAWSMPNAGIPGPGGPIRPTRVLAVGLVIAFMAVAASSLLLTDYGIDAPGFALAVEPMVAVPQQYLHHPAGSFILTSVISQAPIPVGVWLIGKTSPIYSISPPQKPVPGQISPQDEAKLNFQWLQQSEIFATVVGLRLAGYPADITGEGAQVMSVLPESLAEGLLEPGDVITSVDGKPIQYASDLVDLIKTLAPHSTVKLTINRNQKPMMKNVQLIPSSQPGNPPMLGITVQDAGYDYRSSIPVKIVPQKIVGGPSAGLMFALTVYNLLSPTDLTGGRKIAGTGTISVDGEVGPIGGVAQKVAAAESAGAEYFFSPADNYQDALSAARRIKVIRVTTIDEAIAFLQGLPKK